MIRSARHRSLLGISGWLLTACGGVDLPTQHDLGLDGHCNQIWQCASVDSDGGPSDHVVDLGSGALVSLVAGNQNSVQVLAGGQVVFRQQAPSCVPSAGTSCSLTLERLRLELADFRLDLSNGSTLTVAEPVASLVAPIEIQDLGSGFVIPTGSDFQTCATVDGGPQSGRASAPAIGVVTVDPWRQQLSIDAAVPMLLHADNTECTELSLTLYVLAAGVSPWKQ